MPIFDFFKDKSETESARIKDISLEQIVPSRYQPRVVFDETGIQELATSIQQQGLITPITVRQVEDHYEIIAGERRYRACKLLNLETIPCYVLAPNEEQAAQMALVENVQRTDLSAIEEAKAYVEIMRQSQATQEEVARKVGKSQSAIANKIRLLNLPQEIQQAVLQTKLTERHARALLSLQGKAQMQTFHKILEGGWNVQQTEQYIAALQAPKQKKNTQQTKGFTRNLKIALNSIQQCVQLLEKMGIQVQTDQQETENEVLVTIHLHK